jgi:rhodanese-related sulfurtransferase
MFREISPPQAFAEISETKDAVLIDCRTPSEWKYTGMPDLSPIGKKVALISLVDEAGRPNPQFIDSVNEIASTDTPLYLLCRIGGRSANACNMLSQAGFNGLTNIIEGFEGRADESGHRNTIEGWKHHQLPWHQS